MSDKMMPFDERGPSKDFTSDFFSQIPSLKHSQPMNEMSDRIKEIFLFNDLCIPSTDEYIKNKLKILQNDMLRDLTTKLKSYYRALGKIQFYCISASRRFCKRETKNGDTMLPVDLFIPHSAFPRLYRYYLLQGITPKDTNYPFNELKDDVIKMKALHDLTLSELEKMVLYCETIFLDREFHDIEVSFRNAAYVDFIEHRHIALGAWKYGLTLGGNVNLIKHFGGIPMDYISVMLIAAKEKISAKDMLSILDIKYDNSSDEMIKRQKLIIQKNNVDGSWVGYLPHFLLEKEKLDRNFITGFVKHCTGSNFIPYSVSNLGYRIVVQFCNAELQDINSLPVIHSCTNTLLFPGTAYDGDYLMFVEKLLYSIDYWKNIWYDMK